MVAKKIADGALIRAMDRRLRRKDDTTVADRSWHTLQEDPNTQRWTVGGTASDGAYTITYTQVGPDGGSASFSHTRSGAESNTDIASGLVDDINARLADPGDPLRDYVKSASSAATVLSVIVNPSARHFTNGASAAGSGTLAVAPDDVWPITKLISPIRGQHLQPATAIEVWCVQVDSSNVPLANGSTTVDMTVLRAVDRILPGDTPQDDRPVAVTQATTSSGLGMGEPVRLPFNGGRLGVHLSALTSPNGSVDAVEVWYREVVE